MKEEIYTCNECGLIIDSVTTPPQEDESMAGGGELCSLSYRGIMGHNGFISDKHYHYFCFCEVVRRINKMNLLTK